MVTDVFKVIIKMNTAAAVTATIIILIKFVTVRQNPALISNLSVRIHKSV